MNKKTFANIVSFVADKWIFSGLLLNIICKCAWYVIVAKKQNLYGDEMAYYSIAKGLFTASNVQDVISILFSHQHRMPGTSFLIWLSAYLNDTIASMRICAMLTETLLFFISTFCLFRIIGRNSARLFVWIIAISPMITSFSFCFWGDLVAGWLIFLSSIFAYKVISNSTSKLSLLELFLIGLFWGISLYFRPNMIFYGPLLLLVLPLSSRLYCHNSPVSVLRFSFKSASIIILAFLLTWGPWIAGASFFKQQITLQPAQNIHNDKWMNWTIWAFSPKDEMWGYERGGRYEKTVEKLMIDASISRVEALQLIREKVIRNSSPLSYLSAWSRNITNILCNENQWLAGVMSISGISHESSIWFPKIKRDATRGGHQVDVGYVPNSVLYKSILIFNSYWYHFIWLFSLTWFFGNLLKKSRDSIFLYIFIANTVCILSMSIYHPGHGRYIFALLPIISLTSSFGLQYFWNFIIASTQKEISFKLNTAIVFFTILLIITTMIFMP